MKHKINFILLVIQITLILFLPFILPKTIDNFFTQLIIQPIHKNINNSIPNTLKIILPQDITIGEFADFVTEYKQPPKMNNQIYSVAIQRLKNPEKIEETQNLKTLKYLKHQNFAPLRDYELFTPIKVNYLILISSFIIIICILFILNIKNNLNIPNKLKILLLSLILIELILIKPIIALIFTIYKLTSRFIKSINIKKIVFLLTILLLIYLTQINYITIGIALTTIVLFNQTSNKLLKTEELTNEKK